MKQRQPGKEGEGFRLIDLVIDWMDQKSQAGFLAIVGPGPYNPPIRPLGGRPMGYNDGGKRRTDRLKRRKRHEQRLAKKAAAAQTKPASSAPASPASLASSTSTPG
jgi:hypothetical protein